MPDGPLGDQSIDSGDLGICGGSRDCATSCSQHRRLQIRQERPGSEPTIAADCED